MTTPNTVNQIIDALQAGHLPDAIRRSREALEPFGTLLADVFAAGIALGAAQEAAQGQEQKLEVPPEAQDVLRFLATAPVAAEGFRMLRERMGITREAIAKTMGAHANTVADYESGKCALPAEAIYALVKLAGGKIETARAYEQNLTGEGVRTIRKSLGLSQEKFAATFGIPLATLSQWERFSARSLPSKARQRVFAALDEAGVNYHIAA